MYDFTYLSFSLRLTAHGANRLADLINKNIKNFNPVKNGNENKELR